MTLIERFENKFVKKGPDECWEWSAYKLPGGYGQFCIKKGEMRLAHRVSYKIYIGEIPVELDVLHKCDNPRCVNPNHLFIGTHKENMADKIKKGRGNASRGSRQHKSKINEEAAAKIRFEFSKNIKTRSELAKENNIALCTVCRVIKNKTWRHMAAGSYE